MYKDRSETIDHSHPRQHLVNFLTGSGKQHSSHPRPPSITTPGDGGKFSLDGHLLPHPGNTFLCHLPPSSSLYQAIVELQNICRSSRWQPYFAFLPESSFHMTIFSGISGSPLGVDGWPQDYPRTTDLETVNQDWLTALAHLQAPQHFQVRPVGLHDAMGIKLDGYNDEDTASLRALRDRLSELTGLKRPSHDTYQFHTTMGYLLRWFSPAEAEAFVDFMYQKYQEYVAPIERVTIGPVEFCQFANMSHFNMLALIGDQ